MRKRKRQANPKSWWPSRSKPTVRCRSKASLSTTRRLPARLSSTTRKVTARRAFSTRHTSRKAWSRRAGRSCSSTTAARVRPRCGCIWARSDPGASSPTTISTRRRRRMGWSITTTACSMSATSSSSMRRAPDSARSPTRTRGRRNISASISMRMRSPSSSASSCRNTAAGIRRSICSAKATARRVRPFSRTSCRTIRRSISMA